MGWFVFRKVESLNRVNMYNKLSLLRDFSQVIGLFEKNSLLDLQLDHSPPPGLNSTKQYLAQSVSVYPLLIIN